jgi:uncharacterized membrane protein YqgA involved in biofilm formation
VPASVVACSSKVTPSTGADAVGSPRGQNGPMFLTGTLLNVAAVLLGTTVGLVFGAWVPRRMQESLTTGLGLFTLVIGVSMALQVFIGEETRPGDELAVLAGLLAGVVVGELLRLHERLESMGAWFQRRFARDGEPSRIAEAFVTSSLVFCVGPLAILGSIDNGLTGDITLLATKSLLDGVASIAFAAALGPGVYLSAVAVFVVQGSIAAAAFLLGDVMDPPTVLAITAVGGLILLGVSLRLLDLKPVRVANFLPALLLAPLFVRLADVVRGWLGS